jgi:hypothetical protein
VIDRAIQLAVFRAQTTNVQEQESAWTQLERAINLELRRNNLFGASLLTKSLALLFSSWAEANLSKLIHTPFGFEISEIEEIKRTWSESGVGDAWKKTLELGLQRASNNSKSNYLPNIQQAVMRLVQTYAIDPALLRNKIAHGQWKIALNRDNTAENAGLTKAIASLNCVDVDRWRMAHKILASVIEALIESPDGAFHRDYWPSIASLQEELRRRENWTLDTKVAQLRKKPRPGSASENPALTVKAVAYGEG